MKIKEFIDKYHLPDNLGLDHIAVKHPKTGQKIYVVSQWYSGIWFRKTKGSASGNGQMWPCQWNAGVEELEVHKDAKKELGIKK